jgi:hypothetical protein
VPTVTQRGHRRRHEPSGFYDARKWFANKVLPLFFKHRAARWAVRQIAYGTTLPTTMLNARRTSSKLISALRSALRHTFHEQPPLQLYRNLPIMSGLYGRSLGNAELLKKLQALHAKLPPEQDKNDKIKKSHRRFAEGLNHRVVTVEGILASKSETGDTPQSACGSTPPSIKFDLCVCTPDDYLSLGIFTFESFRAEITLLKAFLKDYNLNLAFRFIRYPNESPGATNRSFKLNNLPFNIQGDTDTIRKVKNTFKCVIPDGSYVIYEPSDTPPPIPTLKITEDKIEWRSARITEQECFHKIDRLPAADVLIRHLALSKKIFILQNRLPLVSLEDKRFVNTLVEGIIAGDKSIKCTFYHPRSKLAADRAATMKKDLPLMISRCLQDIDAVFREKVTIGQQPSGVIGHEFRFARQQIPFTIYGFDNRIYLGWLVAGEESDKCTQLIIQGPGQEFEAICTYFETFWTNSTRPAPLLTDDVATVLRAPAEE